MHSVAPDDLGPRVLRDPAGLTGLRAPGVRPVSHEFKAAMVTEGGEEREDVPPPLQVATSCLPLTVPPSAADMPRSQLDALIEAARQWKVDDDQTDAISDYHQRLITNEAVSRASHMSLPTRLRNMSKTGLDAPAYDYFTRGGAAPTAVFGLPVGSTVIPGCMTKSQRQHVSSSHFVACVDALSTVLQEGRGEVFVEGMGMAKYWPSVTRIGVVSTVPCVIVTLEKAPLCLQLWLNSIDQVVDVEVAGESQTVSDWDKIRVWCGALVRTLHNDPRLVVQYVVLDDCGMNTVARPAKRVWAGPHQACNKDVPTPEQIAVRVPCGLYTNGLVSYGSLPALEVPVGTYCVFGMNGGKSVTGVALPVKYGQDGVFIVTSDAITGMPAYPHITRVLPPLSKDTASSRTLCRSMRGASQYGDLMIQYEHSTHDLVTTETPTFITDAMVDGAAVVHSRNLLLLREDLVCMLKLTNCVLLDNSDGSIRACTADNTVFTLFLEYGSTTGFDFLTYAGPTVEADNIAHHLGASASSELLLATGMSSVARYIMRDVIIQGRLVPEVTSLLRASRPVYDEAEWRFGKTNLAPLENPPTDFVIDFEFVNHTDSSGNHGSFVYAAGLAKFEEGNYRGSILAVDRSAEGQRFMSDPKLRREDTINYNELLLSNSLYKPSVVLQLGRELAKLDSCRVWAKGRDNDCRLLSATPIRDSDLLCMGPPNTALRELGHLTKKAELLAVDVGWPINHDPARECVLFAYATGLCHVLPHIETVGKDCPDVFMPTSASIFT